jgi:hypothetical protein
MMMMIIMIVLFLTGHNELTNHICDVYRTTADDLGKALNDTFGKL